MISKVSTQEARNDHPLDNSKHDRPDYSSSKPASKNLEYSRIFNDRSNNRQLDNSNVSFSAHRCLGNKNYTGQTPKQPAHLESRKRVDPDENRYVSWTPSNVKLSSPKSSVVLPGNRSHRDYPGRLPIHKMPAFHEHGYYPLRPNDFQRTQVDRNLYKKAKPILEPTNRTNQLGKQRADLQDADQNNKKDKFFQYVLKYSYRSKKGFALNNPGKVNQDAYIIDTSIGKKSWQHYFGICDGHGTLGHHVSGFIKTNLPKAIDLVNGVDKSQVKETLFKAFKVTNDKLVNESGIQLGFSGSTVVGCYLNHNKLYCCNVGDSRAVIGYKRDNKWGAKQLSLDHKPSEQSESERILKKGRIQQCRDHEGRHVGPLRVWLKDQNAPGLAMTRSFGDLVAASVGVSWQPQITQFTLTNEDRIIIIASDGVWEFLENEDIVSKLAPYYERNQVEQGCDFLLEYANSSWTALSPVVDDISFVLIFMGYTT